MMNKYVKPDVLGTMRNLVKRHQNEGESGATETKNEGSTSVAVEIASEIAETIADPPHEEVEIIFEVRETSEDLTMNDAIDVPAADQMRQLRRRHEEDQARGAFKLTERRVRILYVTRMLYPEPIYAHQIHKILAEEADAPSVQTVRDALEWMASQRLLTRDELPTPSKEGAARQLYQISDIEEVDNVLISEFTRRLGFARQLGGCLPASMRAALDAITPAPSGFQSSPALNSNSRTEESGHAFESNHHERIARTGT